jgi:uncharacterized Zn finger protein
MRWSQFREYVPVAQRKANAKKELAKKLKKGETASPVTIEGRKITKTFWGDAWCTNLEGYSDFANRLPRGRTYVGNGSVVNLKMDGGTITAHVAGSELYTVKIQITALPKAQWEGVKKDCKGKIGSLVGLLRGELSKDVMEVVTNRHKGLFPKPAEIKMSCSCPDYAGMCKHIAATMYGVGHRLDSAPELLFQLRCVDHKELIESAIPSAPGAGKSDTPTLAGSDLGDIFGIEFSETAPAAQQSKPQPKATKTKAKPKPKAKTPTKKRTLPKKG